MREKEEVVFEDGKRKIVIRGAYLYEVKGSEYKKLKALQRVRL